MVCPCVYLCTTCPPGVHSGQKRVLDVGTPGTGVTYGSEPSSGCWDSNPSLLQDQQVLLTIECCLGGSRDEFSRSGSSGIT